MARSPSASPTRSRSPSPTRSRSPSPTGVNVGVDAAPVQLPNPLPRSRSRRSKRTDMHLFEGVDDEITEGRTARLLAQLSRQAHPNLSAIKEAAKAEVRATHYKTLLLEIKASMDKGLGKETGSKSSRWGKGLAEGFKDFVNKRDKREKNGGSSHGGSVKDA